MAWVRNDIPPSNLVANPRANYRAMKKRRRQVRSSRTPACSSRFRMPLTDSSGGVSWERRAEDGAGEQGTGKRHGVIS
ncbi:hypothetical protein VTG60DRAFT_356 [Thermothelomyces hinnuleus]